MIIKDSNNEWTNEINSDKEKVHGLAKYLPCWARTSDDNDDDPAEIRFFLSSNELINKLLHNLKFSLIQIGMTAQNFISIIGLDKVKREDLRMLPIFKSPCCFCNTIYDNDGHKHDDDENIENYGSYRREKIDLLVSNQGGLRDFIPLLHKALALLDLITNLLTWQQSVTINDEDDDDNNETNNIKMLIENLHKMTIQEVQDPKDYVENMLGSNGTIDEIARHSTLNSLLLAVINDCSFLCPQIGHAACTLMSILVTNRPLSHLGTIDEIVFIPALFKYMYDLTQARLDSQCIIEERSGITQLLNLAPTLYYLGDWKKSSVILAPKNNVYTLDDQYILLTTIALYSIRLACHNPDYKSQQFSLKDMNRFPELYHARNDQVVHIYGKFFSKLLLERPQSLTIAILFEILYRWMNKGVKVHLIKLFSSHSTLLEPYPDAIKECYDKIKMIWENTSELSYLKSIVDHIIDVYEGRSTSEKRKETKHRVNTEGVLHHCLLNLSIQCSLTTCNNVRTKDGNKALYRCSGACGGLARYCCKEHQKEHYKYHKAFCGKR